MHSTRKFLSSAAAGLALACLCLADSNAATIRLYREGAIPDPAVVAAILGKPRKNRFRGIGGDGTAPMPADGGETLSEDDIRTNAAAAVTAWRAKVGERPAIAPQDPRADSRPQVVAAVSPMPGGESDRAGTSGATRTRDADSAAGRPGDAAPLPGSDRAHADPAGAPNGAVGAGASRPEHRKERATVLAVLVRFANDSSRLSSESRGPLDAIAAGIKLAGYERKIVVEGHANATGSASYNLKLSTLRAEAVKRYLVEKHGIPPQLLVTEGYGSTQPLDAHDPAAGENRLVQFRAVGS
jgi:outer membrane protein OmpA-like peptidoglycan-associated protein